MVDSKYEQYVYTQPRFTPPPEKAKAVPTFGLDEALISRLPGFDFNINFVAIMAPHVSWDPPHKHDCDELLFFISSDP
ncbi:hypothetical protein JXI42_08780, partial [bacterium]|nr:hypothetical protein [bacterium]